MRDRLNRCNVTKYFANSQFIISLLMVMTTYCLGRGAARAAGLALAMAAALKAFPVLLAAYLVCRGRWRALLWMVLFGGIIGVLTVSGMGMASFSFLRSITLTTSRHSLGISGFFSISSMVSRPFWDGFERLSPLMDIARRAAGAGGELSLFALTVLATAGAATDSGWRSFSLWVVAMILLSPIAEPHYLVMLMVPFAWIADAAARGEADRRTIYAAIISYLLAFLRYPLSLLQHYGLGSAGFYLAANNFWFLVIVFAYLAAYSLATSERRAWQDVLPPASADLMRAAG